MSMLAVAAMQGTGHASPEQAIVELPGYVIEGKPDLPDAESWRYAVVDDFEVLCNGSETRATELLTAFQCFRQALAIVRPAPEPTHIGKSLLLCGSRNDFRRFVPQGESLETGITSYLLRDSEVAVIVLDLSTRYLQISGLATLSEEGSRVRELEVSSKRQLFRQYFRYQIPPGNTAATPAWFMEAMCQLIMDLEFEKHVIRFGNIDNRKGALMLLGEATSPPIGNGGVDIASSFSRYKSELTLANNGGYIANAYIGDRPFHTVLRRQALMPMQALFAVQADDPEARNPLVHPLWTKQAYAFVHLCLFGNPSRFRAALHDFVLRLQTEPLSEALFQECFGMSFEAMRQMLKGYIRRPVGKYDQYRLQEGSELTAKLVTFREATQAQIARIQADAFRLAGHRTDALETLRIAYDRGEHDPELLAALGLEELHAGRRDRALQFLTRATENGAQRASAWEALDFIRQCTPHAERN